MAGATSGPSQELQALLKELKLCSDRDLRRCRRRVKLLARDLPLFDSVWIDALVQARRITPYQAGRLESAKPQMLAVGPCVIVDELGGESATRTLLARNRAGGERCVLKLIQPKVEAIAEVQARLERLIEQGQRANPYCVILPQSVQRVQNQLVAVSPYIVGSHLGELLIRRGRFPAGVVQKIAEALLHALASLHAAGLVHGEVNLRNVKLTSQGQIVLLDAGVAPAILPHLNLYGDLAAERFDGIAPELLQPGRGFTIASDLYALGCLLWHLLAGRPPFITADPVSKLTSHQNRPFPELDQHAPETPRPLVQLIRQLTSRNPSERLQMLQQWSAGKKSPAWTGRRKLRRFSRQFEKTVPLSRGISSKPGWKLTAALLFALSGLVYSLDQQGLRSWVLSMRPAGSEQTIPSSPETETPSEQNLPAGQQQVTAKPATEIVANPVNFEEQLESLPTPDAEGLITLEPGKFYEAAKISTAESLIIRSAETDPAVIVLRDQPLQVWAKSFTLENVELRFHPGPEHPAPRVMLLAQCGQLSVHGCLFTASNQESPATTSQTLVAAAWKPLEGIPPEGTRVEFQDTVFSSLGTGVYLAASPGETRLDNCLKLGFGPMIHLTDFPVAGTIIPFRLSNLTLRETGSLLQVRCSNSSSPGELLLEPTACVFHLQTEETPLIELLAEEDPQALMPHLQILGEGNVARSPRMTGFHKLSNGELLPLREEELFVEGILVSEYEFCGPLSRDPQDALLQTCNAPRRSSELPGIRLPQPNRE